MSKYQQYITSVFVLLISMSLSLSTVHFHRTLELNRSVDNGIKTEITTDTNFCPIDGYLFNADVSSPVQASVTIQARDSVTPDFVNQLDEPALLSNNNRSPPAQA